MNEPYTLLGADPANPDTHTLIAVRGVTYSVAIGTEQATADEIAASLAQP